jgi:predicted helicase
MEIYIRKETLSDKDKKMKIAKEKHHPKIKIRNKIKRLPKLFKELASLRKNYEKVKKENPATTMKEEMEIMKKENEINFTIKKREKIRKTGKKKILEKPQTRSNTK